MCSRYPVKITWGFVIYSDRYWHNSHHNHYCKFIRHNMFSFLPCLIFKIYFIFVMFFCVVVWDGFILCWAKRCDFFNVCYVDSCKSICTTDAGIKDQISFVTCVIWFRLLGYFSTHVRNNTMIHDLWGLWNFAIINCALFCLTLLPVESYCCKIFILLDAVPMFYPNWCC